MNSAFAPAAGLQTAPERENTIISRREIEPLLVRAERIAMYYCDAVDCSAAVYGRSGYGAEGRKDKARIQFSGFCGNCFRVPSGNCGEKGHSCGKLHLDALAESRRGECTYIYTCGAGFIYWTSPIYQNGRYAGAITAGQVLLRGRKAAAERSAGLCGGRSAAGKSGQKPEKVTERTHREIHSMARLLGLCAGEISEKGNGAGEKIRRLILSEVNAALTGEADEKLILPSLSGRTDRRNEINNPAAGSGVCSSHKELYSGFNTNITAASRGVLNPSARIKVPQKEKTASCRDDCELPADSSCFMEKERLLFAAFRRGDKKTGGRILNQLMDCVIRAIPENFEVVRFRAIELAVLLSRAAASHTPDADALSGEGNACAEIRQDSPEVNDRYLKRIQESRTREELIENLHFIAERMAGEVFSFRGIRHASVLRRAERYIWENYSRKISLEEIARASGLSAPYFSTVFKEEMGENLSAYLNRLRIERASALLLETEKSLKEIAKFCGFEDQSWFSKIFKNFTGLSPGRYRDRGGGCHAVRENA